MGCDGVVAEVKYRMSGPTKFKSKFKALMRRFEEYVNKTSKVFQVFHPTNDVQISFGVIFQVNNHADYAIRQRTRFGKG